MRHALEKLRLPRPTALQRDQGKSLEPAVRRAAEFRFGFDFSHVRVHTGPAAARSAGALHAAAYTLGSDIAFGPGRYTPETAEGRWLLDHELAHVVEQSQAGVAAVQRQELDRPPDYTLSLSPFFLASMGSLTIGEFVLDSAELTEIHRTLLAGHARMLLSLLESDPAAAIEITGHTDATGTERHNKKLGMERAESARAALVAGGVPAEAVSVRSAGESELKIKTEKEEPRNRRAEIRFRPSFRLRLGTSPKLEMPPLMPPLTLGPKAEFTPPPRIDITPRLNLPPPGMEETPREMAERILRPIPEIKGRKPKSLHDVIMGGVDTVVNRILKPVPLPDWAKDKVREGARKAVEKGMMAPLDTAMDEAGLDEKEKEAIRKAVEAGLKTPIP
ncbi:MAG: DUF4157 domain-containing protein [Bryobacterales bacterium]|nr:DUF4157 domain-containing protein [Bryobacterales bacterium]